jgi:hypothetical protein
MDLMFEDEVDEVGSDVEAYCPKCKGDTTHVVISKYEDEIRRVQCNPCGDVHSYRKPRGEAEDDVPEPVAARKRALLKKPTWEEFFAKHGEKEGKPYEFREHYRDNQIVVHPKFGKGFVSEIVSDSKVELTFQDARRVLVHNRRDIPGLPLAAEGDGHPTPPPSKDKAKAKAAAPAVVAKPAAKADKNEKPAAKVDKAAPAKAEKPAEKKPEKHVEKHHVEKKAEKAPPPKAAAKPAAKPVAKAAAKPEKHADKHAAKKKPAKKK